MPAIRPLTASQRDWLRVRSYLSEHRHGLAVDAAGDYPADRRVAGTPLLAAPGWQPAEPVPLLDVGLELTSAEAQPSATGPSATGPSTTGPSTTGPPTAALAAPAALTALGDAAAALLPERPDGTRYLRYSDALRDLAAPAVFENRATYRLTEAHLTTGLTTGLDTGLTPGASRLAFARGRYFDGIDTGEAAAHEYAAARLGSRSAGLRTLIADPCDLRRRPVNLAISTLTLRLDRASGRASFLLHWRDPAKVGHAGGLYQVIPVGVFQPSGEAAWNERRDFSLWRSMIREFDEELRGRSEEYGSEAGPVDYDSWPFARHMADALDRGQIRAWCLGLGADPLTYATDLLTVVVIDSGVFDELFSLSPRRNAEGSVLAAREFAADVIDRIVTSEPVQAAGAAVLRLAWRHRDILIGLLCPSCPCAPRVQPAPSPGRSGRSLEFRVHDEAAVGEHRRAGHVARVVREQVGDRASQFLGLGGPVDGDAIGVVLHRGRILHHRRAHVGHHPSWLDGVHPDAVLAQVAAEGLGQHADGALGPAVRGLVGRAHVRRDRAHAADRAAMTLADHLLRAFRADHPGTAHVGLEQRVEVLDARLVPFHERVDRGIRHQVVEFSSRPTMRPTVRESARFARIAFVGIRYFGRTRPNHFGSVPVGMRVLVSSTG